jgi:hypothetical protein
MSLYKRNIMHNAFQKLDNITNNITNNMYRFNNRLLSKSEYYN